MLWLMQKTFTMKVSRIAHDGAAEGEHEGKIVRIHGMLPNEEGIVEVHSKHGMYIGELKEITVASPERLLPTELHYLACSPWQVMEYPLQATLKKELIESLYGFYDTAPKVEFVPADKLSGYRTKIEFSFTDRDAKGGPAPLALAFHVRGGGARRMPLPDGCMLASAKMNTTALAIVGRLRELNVPASDLKTLFIRESKSDGKVLAMLFVKNDTNEAFKKLSVDGIPDLIGFIMMYSTQLSPASVPTREMWRWGEMELKEDVLGITIRYAWDAFFQNNIPMFAHALQAMDAAIKQCHKLVELYSGVGTIGLYLARKANEVIGVEIVKSAAAFAGKNAVEAEIKNYKAVQLASEKIPPEYLAGADVLVLDPPRVGLHPDVVKLIMEKLPPQIVYLSCNPETQARDYSQLSEKYNIDRIVGYDFYPQTPHVESLLVLSKK